LYVLVVHAKGQELEPPQDYEVDLLVQIEHINDPELLKQMLIQKEQERQGLSANLDLAARLGLSLHEQIQRLEQDSSAKVRNAVNSSLSSSLLLHFAFPYTHAHAQQLRGERMHEMGGGVFFLSHIRQGQFA